MEQEIKINAEIQTDPAKCRFTVDRPVYTGAAYFASKETAKGSPLAEAIFDIPNVTAVLIANNIVTVTLTTATSIFVALPKHLIPGGLWVKIWSQTGGSGVNQTADRALVIVTQPIES